MIRKLILWTFALPREDLSGSHAFSTNFPPPWSLCLSIDCRTSQRVLKKGSIALSVSPPSLTWGLLPKFYGSANSGDIEINSRKCKLKSGTLAEVITYLPPTRESDGIFSLFGSNSESYRYEKPCLVFLHGSFHASWCWQERYMPFFAKLGYPCVALSLQGTGGTPAVEPGSKKVKIKSHVRDLDALLQGLSRGDMTDNSEQDDFQLDLGRGAPLVLIGHSFGGLTIMKWLEHFYDELSKGSIISNKISSKEVGINISGVALLCSVPPSGNGPMTLRYLFRSISDSWKITVGFAMKRAIDDKDLCRTLFFGGSENDNGITDEDIERYQSYFARDTAATIDLGDLATKLPSLLAEKDSGRAPFVNALPSTSLVIGASEDFIVDKEGLEETAQYMGVDAPVIVDSPHDIMLGKNWKNGAESILEWAEGL